MLRSSEIFLETIKVDGKPERLLKQYEGATFFPPNPATIMYVATAIVVWNQ